jgi:multiple sugar transport system permease protein
MFYITLFLRFLFNFGKFDLIWLLTQGGPLKSTETFPINVWLTAFAEYRYGEAATIAIVSLLILMIPLLLFVYVTRERG